MNFSIMRARSRIIQSIRSFFSEREYLEVETPLLSPTLIPEAPIELFETVFQSPFHGSFPLYLIPSPEVHMKKLLAAGSGNIYQICRSFRNAEQIGPQHNPEFTMLEYYTVDSGYKESISITEELMSRTLRDAKPADAAGAVHSDTSLRPPFRRMTVQEAFYDHAGFDLAEHNRPGELQQAAERLGLQAARQQESWEQLYHRIFLSFVEPNLPTDRPLVLMDYPRRIPCLAKIIPGTPWRERWELYIRGMEVANCYSEETDAAAVEQFFRREYAQKAAESRVVPDIDQEFIDLHASGLPECSGVALGIDRLIMAITGQKTIEGVIFFPLSDSIRP